MLINIWLGKASLMITKMWQKCYEMILTTIVISLFSLPRLHVLLVSRSPPCMILHWKITLYSDPNFVLKLVRIFLLDYFNINLHPMYTIRFQDWIMSFPPIRKASGSGKWVVCQYLVSLLCFDFLCFITCELQTQAGTFSSQALRAQSPVRKALVIFHRYLCRAIDVNLASCTFQTTSDKSSFPPRLTCVKATSICNALQLNMLTDIQNRINQDHNRSLSYIAQWRKQCIKSIY